MSIDIRTTEILGRVEYNERLTVSVNVLDKGNEPLMASLYLSLKDNYDYSTIGLTVQDTRRLIAVLKDAIEFLES